MFDPKLPSNTKAKNTVEMICRHGKRETTCYRPKSKIVAKNEFEGAVDFMQFVDEDFWVGYSGMYADSARGLQLRNRQLELQSHVSGPIGYYSLSPDRSRMLAANSNGSDTTSAYLIDAETNSILDILPVCPPFGWLSNHEFIAQAPSYFGESWQSTDSKLLEDHPHFEKLADPNYSLLQVDLSAQTAKKVTPSLGRDRFDGFRHLEVSHDANTFYCAVDTTAFAFHRSSKRAKWMQLWKRELGKNDEEGVFSLYGFALSPDGKLLATGGISSYEKDFNNFVMLDTTTGKSVLARPLCRDHNTSIYAIAWHPNGWAAVGTGSGICMLVTPEGNVRTFKGATKGIRSIAFPGDGTMLIGGTEKQLRRWPLLEDESESV